MTADGVIPDPQARQRAVRSDAWNLRSALDQALYDEFCLRASYRFGGEEYDLGDSELGEPFVLTRKSDGKRFEVELGAEVREVVP